MDTTLLNIRKLKYRNLLDLVGRQVMIARLSMVEETVLGTLVHSWATSFTLNTSERDIAIGIAKHAALDLNFVTTGSGLLFDSDAATLKLLRGLGLFDEEQKKAAIELGCKDPTGAKDVAESITDAKVFFKVTLASKAPMDNMREFMSEVTGELSQGVFTETAVDAVMLRRIENAANQFPRTFTVEEAFLANSDSIFLRKYFYG